jgi:hypothetical protein
MQGHMACTEKAFCASLTCIPNMGIWLTTRCLFGCLYYAMLIWVYALLPTVAYTAGKDRTTSAETNAADECPNATFSCLDPSILLNRPDENDDDQVSSPPSRRPCSLSLFLPLSLSLSFVSCLSRSLPPVLSVCVCDGAWTSVTRIEVRERCGKTSACQHARVNMRVSRVSCVLVCTCAR